MHIVSELLVLVIVLFNSNSHPLYGPFQLCSSIMFDKSKKAERSQNKMQ